MPIVKPKSYITDKKGSTTAVIISKKDYDQLMEDYQDLLYIAERKDEKSVSLSDFKKKLKGSDSEYRMRCGDYRIIYRIDEKEKIVDIYKIRHRKDVYRKR